MRVSPALLAVALGFSAATAQAEPPFVPFESTYSLYVLDDGNESILRIDPDRSVHVVAAEPEILAATEDNDADLWDVGLAVGADGALYFNERQSNAILKRPPGGPVERVMSKAELKTALSVKSVHVRGLAVGINNQIYITDTWNDLVARIDPATKTATVLATDTMFRAAAGTKHAYLDEGLVIAPMGGVYVPVDSGDYGNGQALFHVSNDAQITLIAMETGGVTIHHVSINAAPGEFTLSYDLCDFSVTPQSDALIAAAGDCVMTTGPIAFGAGNEAANLQAAIGGVLGPGAQVTGGLDSAPTGGGTKAHYSFDIEYLGPMSGRMVPEPDANDASLNGYVLTWIIETAGFSNLDCPLTVDKNGDILLLDDTWAWKLWRVHPDGSVETALTHAQLTDLDGCFDSDGGIAVDQDGNIFIADYCNDNLLKFHPDGQGEVWLSEGEMTAALPTDPDLDAGIAFGRPPICGNGVVEPTEVCDEGDLNGQYGHCDAYCQAQLYCGDGIVNGPEGCDDGDLNGQYEQCDWECVAVLTCGDGLIYDFWGEGGEGPLWGQSSPVGDGLPSSPKSVWKMPTPNVAPATRIEVPWAAKRPVPGALPFRPGNGPKIPIPYAAPIQPFVPVEPGLGPEYCDDGPLNGTYGFCADDCQSVLECGDAIINGDEACDDSDLGGATCADFGFYTGFLACSPDCGEVDPGGCTGLCGDGVLDGAFGETCDDGPLNGTYGQCNASCTGIVTCGDDTVQADEICDGADLGGHTCAGEGLYPGTLACLATCEGLDVSGCGGSCGDGVVQADFGEGCDDGPMNGAWSHCDGACGAPLVCGDGVLTDPEGCDDGDQNGLWGHCDAECGAVLSCGDGVLTDPEGCDEGDQNGLLNHCDEACEAILTCGDGVVTAPEGCDEGAQNGQYGHCAHDCSQLLSCGDGLVSPPESCDEGAQNGSYGHCNGACDGVLACGDGLVTGPEGCDDGPKNGQYGQCDATCGAVLACGDGLINGPEACDGAALGGVSCAGLGFYFGAVTCAGDCGSVVTTGCAGRCGDGVVDIDFGETCDEGDLNGHSDHCADDCHGVLSCGDGVVSLPELCDEGPDNGQSGHCAANCGGMLSCGDGIVSAPEACDEGGANGQYGACRADCSGVESCGDGVISGPEACDGAELGTATCEGLGWYGGALGCAPDCATLDPTACVGRCGDGLINGPEVCDDGAQNGLPGQCSLDCAGASTCGDGVATPPELCDGAPPEGEDCQTWGFYAGDLACAAACDGIDTAGCSGFCGDGELQGDFGEACDDAEMNGQPGHCNAACSGPVACGNGLVEIGELCDDGPLNGQYNLCATDCQAIVTCGDGVITAPEACDGLLLGGATCASQGFYPGAIGCTDTCDQLDVSECGGRCGDGLLQTEAGETCDDGVLNGITGHCDFGCGHVLICGDGVLGALEACDDGELNGTYGHCLSDCTGVMGCGDGVVNGEEGCDDGLLNGAYGHCDSGCVTALACGDGIKNGDEACDGDDLGGLGCEALGWYQGALACADDCAALDEAGCSGRCGDGALQADAEACDEGADNGLYGHCDGACAMVLGCGDGVINGPESCDEGANNGTIGACNAACTGFVLCGDGVIQAALGEGCDDGALNGTYGHCDLGCGAFEVCGDGIVSGPEGCDEGTLNGTYGHCDGACGGLMTCGDGWVNGAEACDDGAQNGAYGHCTADCGGWLGCGDSVVQAEEGCDDGDGVPGDGCDADCAVEAGWQCDAPGEPCVTVCGDGLRVSDEGCDDGNQVGDDGCDATCTVEPGWVVTPDGLAAVCGDGERLGAEACDDGGLVSGDGCSAACELEEGWTATDEGYATTCGDGVAVGDEGCDDGNLETGDGCDAACAVEPGWVQTDEGFAMICGDGILVGDEPCDDGNAEDGDGCSATCAVEEGFECDDAEPTVCRHDHDGDGLWSTDELLLGTDPEAADTDGDGLSDGVEAPGGEAVDTDQDGTIDALDLDSDDDGLSDAVEALAGPEADADDDGVPNWRDSDSDNDGLADGEDVCPLVPDVDQKDTDGDGVGDACTDDADGDGVLDETDNCPGVKNADQADSDGDGVGDVCAPPAPIVPAEPAPEGCQSQGRQGNRGSTGLLLLGLTLLLLAARRRRQRGPWGAKTGPYRLF